jgi:DNA-binding NarL/FixJ family response regulator
MIMRNSSKPRATSSKSVFIVEDHPVFCEGLTQLLHAERDLELCGTAGNANLALRRIARLKPDLVLIDIGLPGKSGLELLKELRAMDRDIKLLVVSMHDEAIYANRVLRAGGDGYVMKQEDPEEIVNAIHDVLAGRIYVSEDVLAGSTNGVEKEPPKSKARPIDELSDEELEVLEKLGRGMRIDAIAHQLGLTTRVVNARCRSIKARLKFKRDNDLNQYAVRWVETGVT